MGHTFKIVTVVGTSDASLEEAIRNAIRDAGASLRNLGWFEVREMRGRITDHQVTEFQVKVQVGFRVEVP